MNMSLHLGLTRQFLQPNSAVRKVPRLPALAVLLVVTLLSLVSTQLQAALQFSEVSGAAGAAVAHGYTTAINEIDESESGGVAAGDYDHDGDIDLYVIAGPANANSLLRNKGDGTFENVAATAGVGLSGTWSSGPVFADINGDGWDDLLVGTMQEEGYHVFINDQDGTFTDFSASSGITQGTNQNDISSGLGDMDNDGDLDLFIGHHSFNAPSLVRNHLWANNGAGVFTAVDIIKGTNVFGTQDRTFSATFVDINKDGWQDILVSADNGDTTVFKNDKDGTFTNVTNQSTITDQNGMGTAAADYDNDGDIDWFVTSIHDHPNGPVHNKTGNRLYINNGSGAFSETSSAAGVRLGYWGWAACAADFDNDGWLDLFHVNGMYELGGDFGEFAADPSRLFINDKDGSFTESSAAVGLVDTGQGRAEVCFDYDNDGDIDIFVFNAGQTSKLFRNNLTNNPGWLQVDVAVEIAGKTTAGTLIEVVTGGLTQTRQITVGSNLMSQNPLRQHFGLGGAVTVDQVKVTWPSGTVRILTNQNINQILEVGPPPPPEPPIFKNGFES